MGSPQRSSLLSRSSKRLSSQGAPPTQPSSPLHGGLLSPSSSRASTPSLQNLSGQIDPITGQVVVRETNVMVKQYDPSTGHKMINRYVMINELGRGVHGKVKLCMDSETGDYYVRPEEVFCSSAHLISSRCFQAIKIVHKQTKRRFGLRTDDTMQKIRKEIAIMKRCLHPNVVRLFEVIDDPNEQKIYLVLEYVDGGELVWKDPESEAPVLEMEDARKYFLDVVLGLDYRMFPKGVGI